MPFTIEYHLAGVTEDAPHPLSYRPDILLRSFTREQKEYDKGLSEGFDKGYEEGERDAESASEFRRAKLLECIEDLDALASQIVDWEDVKTIIERLRELAEKL